MSDIACPVFWVLGHNSDIIYFEVEGKDSTGKGDMSLEVAIQYTDRYNETILSYANNINTVMIPHIMKHI